MPQFKVTARITFTVDAEDRNHAADKVRGIFALGGLTADRTNVEHAEMLDSEEQPQTQQPERLTISQGPDVQSPSRPYWLSYRFRQDSPERVMHFSSALARTLWVGALKGQTNATITGQGDDL